MKRQKLAAEAGVRVAALVWQVTTLAKLFYNTKTVMVSLPLRNGICLRESGDPLIIVRQFMYQ